jgi:thiamine biosynthesis lipoprotein
MAHGHRAGVSRRELLGAAGIALLPMAARADGLHRQHLTLFGSPCTLLVPGQVPLGAPVALRLWRRLRHLHEQWNAWKPGLLGDLNAVLRAGRPAAVPADLYGVLRGARRIEAASGGMFNAGLGGVVGAWGFHADELRPGPAPRAALLRRWRLSPPGLAHAEFRAGHIIGHHPALQVDLGGYAKGTAVDEALDGLQAAGIRDALLDLGGNLAVIGQGADGPWRIGIRDPFGPGLVAAVRSRGREAVVTSGTYERFREVDGEVAGHVIDPVSARPAAGLVSITVVHRSAGMADAAATALLAAGPSRWQALAQRLGLQQVLVIDCEGRATAHARLAARLEAASGAWQRALHVV